MAIVLTATQQTTLTLRWEDSKGNPARVDGVPAWSVSPPALGTLTVDAAGASAVFAAGATGTGQIRAIGDADLGPGTRPVDAVLDVEVVAGEAAVGVIEATPPVDQ